MAFFIYPLTKLPTYPIPSGGSFLAFLLAGFRLVAQRPAFVRRRVGYQAVGFAPLVVFGQVLGDGKAFAVHEQQAVAVFVDLHVITGADPSAMLDFFVLVRIKAARAERFAQSFMVAGQAQDNHLGHLMIGVGSGSGLFAVFLHEFAHFLDGSFTGLFTHRWSPC